MMKRKLIALTLCLVLAFSLAAPALAADSAVATGCEINAFGKPVTFSAYTANGTVYLRLRDVAQALNGSDAQFNVDWKNGGVVITTGVPYTSAIGSEMAAPFAGDQEYVTNPNPITANGEQASLDAIFLTDAKGNGYTYCSPETLRWVIGFVIFFDEKTGDLAWEIAAPPEGELGYEDEAQETEAPAQEAEETGTQETEEAVQEEPVKDEQPAEAEATEESVGGVDPIIWTGA